MPPYLRAWVRTRTDKDPLTTIGVQFDELGIIGRQLQRLPSSLLRTDTAAKLAASDDAIQAVCDKDAARLARAFEVSVSEKLCEQTLQDAEERVRTDQAVGGSIREVEMRARQTSIRVPPGVPTARSPDRGRPIGTPVHLELDARGAQRLSTEPLHRVLFVARADDDPTAETRPELSGAEPRNPEPRQDESGASARSEAGAAVNGRPKPARMRPREMTPEEREAHKRQRRQASNDTLTAKRRAARQLNQQSEAQSAGTGTLGASSATDSSELPGELRA